MLSTKNNIDYKGKSYENTRPLRTNLPDLFPESLTIDGFLRFRVNENKFTQAYSGSFRSCYLRMLKYQDKFYMIIFLKSFWNASISRSRK